MKDADLANLAEKVRRYTTSMDVLDICDGVARLLKEKQERQTVVTETVTAVTPVTKHEDKVSVTATPRPGPKGGRPKKANAMTPAERMRKMRVRRLAK